MPKDNRAQFYAELLSEFLAFSKKLKRDGLYNSLLLLAEDPYVLVGAEILGRWSGVFFEFYGNKFTGGYACAA
jgi:hypothetical protein